MSLKSFFDSSFFTDLFTMPLKGGTWIKINRTIKAAQLANEANKLEENKTKNKAETPDKAV